MSLCLGATPVIRHPEYTLFYKSLPHNNMLPPNQRESESEWEWRGKEKWDLLSKNWAKRKYDLYNKPLDWVSKIRKRGGKEIKILECIMARVIRKERNKKEERGKMSEGNRKNIENGEKDMSGEG
jgi:hypothetical protein